MLQFKGNNREDFAAVRTISAKLHGGYRHLERSIPFRVVK